MNFQIPSVPHVFPGGFSLADGLPPGRTNGGGLMELSPEELLAEDEEASWGFFGGVGLDFIPKNGILSPKMGFYPQKWDFIQKNGILSTKNRIDDWKKALMVGFYPQKKQ